MANYANLLTRDYLEYLGITNVSEDGTKIMKGDTEVKQNYDGHYKLVGLYDPAIRKATAKELRTNSTGQLHIGVHRIVYCWHHRIIPAGMVIDHINNNKLDNRLQNLQLFTPKENINKERKESTREMPCKLDRPRSYYEDKLAKYEALYEEAKANKDANEAHKLRTYIAQIRARIRYWDSHQQESKAINKSNKDLKLLDDWKKLFKEKGNKSMWHQLCKVIKQWDTYNDLQKEHVLQTLNKTFGNK